MTIFSVEYLRRNPLFDPLQRMEKFEDEDSAMRRMEVLTSFPPVLEVKVFREDVGHRILLRSWTRISADNGRTVRQDTLSSPHGEISPSGRG